MSKKVKPVSDIVKTFLTLGLNLAQSQIRKNVQNDDVIRGTDTVFPLIHEVIKELNDDNPDNAQQIRETMAAWANGPLADYIIVVTDELVAKIDDDNEKELILFVRDVAVELLRIVTDLNPDNVEQIRAAYLNEQFAQKAKDALLDNVIWPMLEKKNIDPAVRNTITIVMTELLSLFFHRSNA